MSKRIGVRWKVWGWGMPSRRKGMKKKKSVRVLKVHNVFMVWYRTPSNYRTKDRRERQREMKCRRVEVNLIKNIAT